MQNLRMEVKTALLWFLATEDPFVYDLYMDETVGKSSVEALKLSIRKNNLDTVQILLRLGEKVVMKDPSKKILSYAAPFASASMYKLLLDYGGDRTNRLALYTAALFGNVQIIDYFTLTTNLKYRTVVKEELPIPLTDELISYLAEAKGPGNDASMFFPVKKALEAYKKEKSPQIEILACSLLRQIAMYNIQNYPNVIYEQLIHTEPFFEEEYVTFMQEIVLEKSRQFSLFSNESFYDLMIERNTPLRRLVRSLNIRENIRNVYYKPWFIRHTFEYKRSRKPELVSWLRRLMITNKLFELFNYRVPYNLLYAKIGDFIDEEINLLLA